jgi:hypothetical protein
LIVMNLGRWTRSLCVAGARVTLAFGVAALVVASAGVAQADTIADYDIATHTYGSPAAGTLALTADHANVTASDLTMVGVAEHSQNGFFRSDDWDTTLNTGEYYQVTITVNAGYTMFLAAVGAEFSMSEDPTGSGTFTSTLRSSLDGYASNLDVWSPGSTGNTLTRTVNLSGLGGITGAITFRWYLTTSAGQLAGFSGANPAGPDEDSSLVFSGTVSAVPEPGTLALVGLGAAGVAFARRRRKARV